MKNNLSSNYEQLITKLKQLIASERKITAEIVELIKEVDQKRIYLNYGYTSMFSFLTKEMSYTPTSAIRRINAARILREIPELKENLKAGSINLSQASMIAEAVRQKQKVEPSQKVSKEMKQDLLQQVQSLDLIATEKLIAQSLDLEIKIHEKKHFQKDESIRLEVTLTKEQWANLERVKELISHQNTNPSVSDLIELLTKNYLDKKDPLRQKIKSHTTSKTSATVTTSAPDALMRHPLEYKDSNSKENKPTQKDVNENSSTQKDLSQNEASTKEPNQPPNKNRYIPQKVRQTTFRRDQSCQWITQTPNHKGRIVHKKCGSKFQLQIDHKKPRWQDGANNTENLQILCATHNKLKYQYEMTGKL